MKESLLIDPAPQRWGVPIVPGLRRGLIGRPGPADWRLPTLAGRFVEVSGDKASAALTLVFRLLRESQAQGEPAAWVGRRDSVFFPPDAASAGVDVGNLPVVWVAEARSAVRAADHLLRSGAFGMVVIDLGANAELPLPAQMRLAGLAKKNRTALVCLTENEASHPSLGSLVSLRVLASRAQWEEDRFRCEARILKDKRRGPGWKHTEVCHGPDGLR